MMFQFPVSINGTLKASLVGLVSAAALVSGACKQEETPPPPTLQEVDPAAAQVADNDPPEVDETDPEEASDGSGLMARAKLQAAADFKLEGEVTFEETGDGIGIRATVQGLPKGTHGFHIHEHGDCSAADFSSAGDHFNPEQNDHGEPGAASHAGDLGNIEVSVEGVTEKLLNSRHIILREGMNSVVGRAVIIHAKADDLKSQPSGDAGSRIACGVIELVAAP